MSCKFSSNMVEVEISDGVLEGEVIEDEIAGKYYSFKGIPFAAPPVNELRFKEPQPVDPWTGVKSAKEFGSPCYQADPFTQRIFGSEDCLYLNVYTPEITPNKPLPVMVWIHWGGFIWGSGNDDLYGPEFLVKQGVILVTFNYRLGALGFLSLDSEDVPGNTGMKDQVAALRWVQKNISKFGGDPENVTIFGESAGGASVSYHLISPMSKGLFKRAISQSGSMTCWFAKSFEHREAAVILARKLGFYSNVNKELYDFFKKQPIEKLVNVDIPITASRRGKLGAVTFTVVDEKDFGSNEVFFSGHPYEALRNGIHEGVDVITGYTEDESVCTIKRFLDVDNVFEKINYFSDFLAPEPITEYCSTSQQVEVSNRLRNHYFGQEKVSLECLDQILKYLSTNMFIYGVIQWAKIASSNARNNKVYFYRFGCKSERNLMTALFGAQELVTQYIGDKTLVCHADDLAYLFPIKMSGIQVDKEAESYRIIENITKMWTNFAKYGNPTPDDSLSVKWLPYNVESERYLHLSNQLQMKVRPDAEEVAVWENIFREFCPKYIH